MMELFEIAKNMELEGKQLYEHQAKNTEDEGLKNILLMLANQEQEHYKIFDALHKNQPIKLKRESFKGITDFFKEVREDLPKDQVELYTKILDVEKKSQEFYKDLAKNQEAQQIKEIILRIAEEEHKHWIIIKNIIEYIKKPDQWVEDPEFHQLEDY
jgi:rubrerythrin